MASISQGLVLTTAMVVSSTVLYLGFLRQKAFPQIQIHGDSSDSREPNKKVLRSCLCSGKWADSVFSLNFLGKSFRGVHSLNRCVVTFCFQRKRKGKWIRRRRGWNSQIMWRKKVKQGKKKEENRGSKTEYWGIAIAETKSQRLDECLRIELHFIMGF